MTAKNISRGLCVAVALYWLPHPAAAGVDLKQAVDMSGLEIHFNIADSSVELSDKASGLPALMTPGASQFTLTAVGSIDDLEWGLTNSGLGTSGWDMVDAPTEIPEPAPLAIIGMAILALGFYRRRRNS